VHAHSGDRLGILLRELAALLVFIAALVMLRRCALAPRRAIWLVLGGGAVLQVVALSGPPVTSDDDFRYVWDAKVQLAGIDPYRYPPAAAQLAHLRDGFLFPHEQPCPYHRLADGGCTRINRPAARTIYPPVAQAAFVALRVLSLGGHGGHLPLQIAAAAGALLIGWLLARSALARRRPIWTVALWAWCPITAMELGNNAHLEWLAVLLSLLALTAAGRGRWAAAGALLGAGVATKIYPGVLAAVIARRRPWPVLAAGIGVVAVSYLPHVLAVGPNVVGYLQSYLRESGYDSGAGFRLIRIAVPAHAAPLLALLIMTGMLAWAWRHAAAREPAELALAVVAAAIVVTTPSLPWYTLLLLALAALTARPQWLAAVAAPTIAYLAVGAGAPRQPTTALAYGVAVGVVLVAWLWHQATTPAGIADPRHRVTSLPHHDPAAAGAPRPAHNVAPWWPNDATPGDHEHTIAGMPCGVRERGLGCSRLVLPRPWGLSRVERPSGCSATAPTMNWTKRGRSTPSTASARTES
jgi:alpha-1,2-mannosyltransferase